MRRALISFLAGLLFGIGLTVSQMIDPAKVLGFLDIAGRWDPTLLTVMAGAILGAAPGFMLARRRRAPLFAARYEIPTRRDLDGRLVGGATLFGVGWGLAGFCPGPALAAIGLGLWPVYVFVTAMIVGMGVHRAWLGRPAAATVP